jgi:hypothetical protein
LLTKKRKKIEEIRETHSDPAMHETTTKQQMKNENKSDGEHDDIDVNSDMAGCRITPVLISWT